MKKEGNTEGRQGSMCKDLETGENLNCSRNRKIQWPGCKPKAMGVR